MRLYQCVIILFVISLSFTWAVLVPCAVVIDGKDDEAAWSSAESYLLVGEADNTNSCVGPVVVSTVFDSQNSIMYLTFKVDDKAGFNETSQTAIELNIDNKGAVRLTPKGISAYDTDSFVFEASFSQLNPQSYCAEIAVTIKYGFDELNRIKVRFVDGAGAVSSSYYLAFEKPEPSCVVLGTTEPKNTNSINDASSKTLQQDNKTQNSSTTKPEKTTAKKQEPPRDNVTVYITVPTPLTPDSSFSQTEPEQTDGSNAFVNFDSFKVVGPAALLIVTFGVCMLVNYKKSK